MRMYSLSLLCLLVAAPAAFAPSSHRGGAASVTFDRAEAFGGEAVGGTVHLTEPAVAGGETVDLTATDPAFHVPDSVLVPEGATEAAFTATLDPAYGTDFQVGAQAVFGGATSDPALVTVRSNPVTLSFRSPEMVGGQASDNPLTVTFGWVPMDGVSFMFGSSMPDVLNYTKGFIGSSKSAQVPTFSRQVSKPTVVTIDLGPYTHGDPSTTVTLLPLRAGLSFSPNPLTGGTEGTGTVTLGRTMSDPVDVALSCNDPEVTVPASVTVPAGQKTLDFPIDASLKLQKGTARVTATVNGNAYSAPVKTSSAPMVGSVNITAKIINKGMVRGSISINSGNRTVPTTLALFSSDPALEVPKSVTIPAGETHASFDAIGHDVKEDTPVTLTATLNGSSASATTTVIPIRVVSFQISPATLHFGDTATIQVFLNGIPAEDVEIPIVSSDPAAFPVPDSLTVSAGSRGSKTCEVKNSIGGKARVQVTVTCSGQTITRTISLVP